MVLVAWGHRNKREPGSTTEKIAGGAHQLWEAVVLAVLTEGVSVCSGEFREEQTVPSEAEVGVQTIYFADPLKRRESH